ncbi:MAG: CDP-diacylglycerol--glycerol-3-phosphate 3-phosphatidyltransferase [Bryobacteraceae bacterium]
MNIPNSLTIARIFFVPLLVAALVQKDVSIDLFGVRVANEWLALAIFLFAAGTDLLDGYLARRWGQVTTIGTLLDPIADKLLISAALISLVQVQVAPAWMVILIVGREFAVTGLRGIAAAEGYTIQAGDLGKTKMVSQVAAISFLLAGIRYPAMKPVGDLLLWGVVIFGLLSAIDYFRKFWRKIDDRIKQRRRRELLLLERRRKRETREAQRRVAPQKSGSPESAAGELPRTIR